MKPLTPMNDGREAWGRIPLLAFGGDYNPDQWERSVWKEDIRLMREAAVNLVTLGVFSWSWLEPDQDCFDFSGMDEILDLLHDAGIAVDLATPTASPPPWFSLAYPESLFVDRTGRRLGHGSRQGFCPSARGYRDRSAAIVEQLAWRYSDHPAVVLWHVGNEIGGYNIHCWCAASAEAFRRWLRRRHGDLDTLNRAWGTAFWSQRYSAWEQIQPPGATPGRLNPAQQLDFYRFGSDEVLDCYRLERDIIRRHAPATPITTNFMAGTFKWADYQRWAPEMDVISNDHYLVAADPNSHVDLALAADLTRGIAGGRPWLLMEHSTSAVQWQPRNKAKRPGEMLRNSMSHIARGSDGACFFQWRQSDSGVEKWHSAMLPHGGPETKIFREVVQLGSVVERIREVAGSRVSSDIAIVWDYESYWALEMDAHPSIEMTYADEMRAWHRALWLEGVTCDVIAAPMETSALAGYRLVLAPSQYLMGRQTARALADYVEAGGHVFVGPFTGLVDADDRVHPGHYPGALRELLGLHVDEFLPLDGAEAVRLDNGMQARAWVERVVPASAQVEASFSDGPAAGSPALLGNRVGRGLARYAAARFEDSSLRRALRSALAEAGCSPLPGAGDGVEIVRRSAEGKSWLFVINHTQDTVHVPCRGFELVTEIPVDATLPVAPGTVAVVREQS